MQKIVTVAVILMATTLMAAEIGVIREFQNRKPAFDKLMVDSGDLLDFNRDGVADLTAVFDDTFLVVNPRTMEKLWSYPLSPSTVSPDDELSCFFVPFDGNTTVVFGKSTPFIFEAAIVIINPKTNETLYSGKGKLSGVFKSPAGEYFLLPYIEQQNLYQVVGVLNGTKAERASETPTILESSTLTDFNLTLKFESDPGLQLAYDPNLYEPPGNRDIDDDGYQDIPLLTIEAGKVTGVVVRGGDDFAVLWQHTFQEQFRAKILKGFHGLADINGDGTKEAIVGENLAITRDGVVHTIEDNLKILDVNDVDNDGYADIIGLNTNDSTIVVYGAINQATSVTNYDPAAMHFQLFGNYPNPFNPSTNISFSVHQAGQVELTIYNTLGQRVRTLVNERKTAGNYSLSWDGRNDAGHLLSSGPYFYRLKAGEQSQTRRMLFLK